MEKWICPYCRSEASVGTCPGCKAQLTADDLIFGEPLAQSTVLNTDFAVTKPESDKKDSKLTELVRAGADSFNPHDAFKLGVAYYSGIGVAADYALAYKLFYSAATRGEKEALFYLGECHRMGKGTEQDDERAKFFYMEGAGKGDGKCASTLKIVYGVSVAGGMFYSDKLGGGDFVQLVDKLYTNVAEVHASSRLSMTASAGSGAIITGDYVVTNAHVILSSNGYPHENIYICAGNDSRRYEVRTVTFSAAEDIAVLAFTDEKPPLTYGERLFLRSAATAKVGEDVFTIGNPNDMGLNVTKGIVSRAAERDGNGRLVLRTDMTINHGNSGGPLFDAGGNVLGLMTYSISEASGEKLGNMSFAVTSDTILEIMKKIQ